MGGTGEAPTAQDPAGGRGAGGTTSVVAPAAPPANVFGHESLSGWVRTRLEPSGRLTLPSLFKAVFVDRAVIASRGDRLLLWTPQAFDLVIDDLIARQPAEVLDPQTRADLYNFAPKVTIDRQHRFVVPPELREEVDLGEEIVLAGGIEVLNIWPAARYDAVQAPKAGLLGLLLDGHGGLPTGTA